MYRLKADGNSRYRLYQREPGVRDPDEQTRFRGSEPPYRQQSGAGQFPELRHLFGLSDRGEVLCTEGLDFAFVIDMERASVQALNIQVHGILKDHGRERQAVMSQAIEEGVEVHFVG